MHSRTPLSLSCCVTYPHPRERVEHKRCARCAEMCSPNENVAMVVLLLLRCCVLRAERDRRTVVFLIAALASLPPLLSSSTITSQPLVPLSCTDIKEPSMAARFCTPRQPQLAWFPLLPQSFLQPSMSVSHLCLSSPLALLTSRPSAAAWCPLSFRSLLLEDLFGHHLHRHIHNAFCQDCHPCARCVRARTPHPS
jgi:hypothetical protein